MVLSLSKKQFKWCSNGRVYFIYRHGWHGLALVLSWDASILEMDGLMYHDRKSYEDMKRTMWKLGDWAGGVLHKRIAVPLMLVLPSGLGRKLYDWTHKLWMKWGRYDEF